MEHPHPTIAFRALRLCGNLLGHQKNVVGEEVISNDFITLLKPFFLSKSENRLYEALWSLSNISAGSPKMQKALVNDKDILDELLEILQNSQNIKLVKETILIIGNISGNKYEDAVHYLVEHKLLEYLVVLLETNTPPSVKFYVLKILFSIFEHKRSIEKVENQYADMFHNLDTGNIDDPGHSDAVAILESLAIEHPTNSLGELSNKILDYFFRESSL